MPVSPIELGPFTEGVNLVDPLTKLSPNELSYGLNWRTGVRGNFYKRPGHDLYGSSPAKINGDNLVNLLLRYYKSDGSKLTIAAAGGKLRYGNDSTGAWTDISINGSGASMHTSNLCEWLVYKDRLYIADGTRPQRYNGVDDIYAGHFIPAAPSLAQATGGVLTLSGTYKYLATSVAGNMGEGPAGAVATITLTGSNNKVTLTLAATAAKYEETTFKIYRTKANGSIYYFLTELTTGTTSYVDSTIPDTGLGIELIPAQDPPATARFVILGHDERVYWFGMSGVDASLVRVSDVGFPDRIPNDGVNGFFAVANNDGDTLTGGGLVPGGIVFFKRTSVWLSRGYGFGLINIYPREKKGAGVGSTSPFSIVSTPVGLIFLSQRGEIYKFDGTNVEEIGRKIASEFKGMTQTALNNVVACYHDYRYIISYDWRGTKGYNWRTLEYDTIADKWDGPFENLDFYTPSYYSVWDSVLDKGELYWGEARALAGSYIYGRNEFTETDRGNKFLSVARSGARALGGLGEVKTTKSFIHGEISGDTTLTFTHIDETGTRTSVVMVTPNPSVGSVLGGSDLLGLTPPSFVLGGSITEQVSEGPLEPCRSRVPIYEISDGGTSTRAKMNLIQILADALPLK